MSISEKNLIDLITIENRIAVLTISDHLEWNKDHLFLLQEKINSYIQYIESGQISENICGNDYDAIEIKLIYKYIPDDYCVKFLSEMKFALMELKLRFSHGLLLKYDT